MHALTMGVKAAKNQIQVENMTPSIKEPEKYLRYRDAYGVAHGRYFHVSMHRRTWRVRACHYKLHRCDSFEDSLHAVVNRKVL